ncbi:MAG TPA: hypothetical protein VLL08_06990 [Kineosporiaceae bacterium]|nr:hypothetical protein [Kineosporiaceae bacterium]
MSPIFRAAAATAAAFLVTGLTATAASAADTTPPARTRIGTALPYQCLSLVLSADRSTDNVTPQSELRYEAFADGVFIGTLLDSGQPGGAWGFLHLLHPGSSVVTVRVVDAVGNRSAFSPGVAVTAFYRPGCVPGHL